MLCIRVEKIVHCAIKSIQQTNLCCLMYLAPSLIAYIQIGAIGT